MVLERVEGLGVRLEVEFNLSMVCEWCGLRRESEVDIGCSVAGALVGGSVCWGVGVREGACVC